MSLEKTELSHSPLKRIYEEQRDLSKEGNAYFDFFNSSTCLEQISFKTAAGKSLKTPSYIALEKAKRLIEESTTSENIKGL